MAKLILSRPCFYVPSFASLAVELDVEDNYLSGDLWPIPEMASIQRVFVYDNIIGGEATTSPVRYPVMRAASLHMLDLLTNYYYGTVPAAIEGIMARMEELYLEDLELEGTIMPELLTGPSRLRRLYLGQNYLESSLPVEIGSAGSLGKKLEQYSMHPMFGTLLRRLTGIYLFISCVRFRVIQGTQNYRETDNGSIQSKVIITIIPATISKLARLEGLRLEYNFIAGLLPTELSTLVNLARFGIDLNVLRGAIPTSFGNLIYLRVLTLPGK